MNLPFRAPLRSMRGDEPDTPYRRARQQWDERMGLALDAARAWRLAALIKLAIIVLLAAGLTLVALQKRTFVHVVEVSPEGQVLSVRAADGRWRPTNAQIAYHIGQFIRLVRSLPTDAVVLRENWLHAYKYLTPQAAAQLNEIARQDDPFLSLGRVGRSVEVRAILARSNNVWEVSWVERAANAHGSSAPHYYTGVFSVSIRPPRDADQLASNPLGILISDFSWSRER